MIVLQRVYDTEGIEAAYRFLIERLWPRGIKKSALQYDAWLKDAAPSAQLRTWFQHDPAKWDEFRKRYFEELDARPESWQPILEASRRGTVALLYSSRDTEHNNAVALKEYLDKKKARK
jgi:uncharacterized protein YeaO (DUF488 family)